MSRPICGHCGKPYGQRWINHEYVRWDTPTKLVEGSRGEQIRMADGPISKPPEYRGNMRVIKEGTPYLSASDGRAVMDRYTWDGESYHGGYDPFCTLRCALDYARKAYARNNHALLHGIRRIS